MYATATYFPTTIVEQRQAEIRRSIESSRRRRRT
jgi:hypothetical protein